MRYSVNEISRGSSTFPNVSYCCLAEFFVLFLF
uniref:Uncharacterized protein n=1 Tax=Anguilla anguilla TaxID=7936 RepID=A0A0E9UGZ6_ANGAN